jgi:acyl-CoA dehydrogenase
MSLLQFDRVSLDEATATLRQEVREFIEDNRRHLPRPNSDFATGHDPEFSAKLGAKRWIGLTWPSEFGGSERSFFERYVVTEEILAAGAPVCAHWIADRQSGPLLLRFGSQAQKEAYLPGITRGESFFSIGMSEPDTGSDLASVRTTAVREGDAYRINGTKIWTTDAHRNHYIICLVRTDAPSENRHAGLSQIVVDLKQDGAQVRPIANMAGGEDFNEVVFDDVLVPLDRIVGEPGNGWQQVTSELGYERSGPERFLSSFRVFVELIRTLEDPTQTPHAHQNAAVGRIASHIMTMRRMSISVAGMLEQGKEVAQEAALVKELGNSFEKVLPEIARLAAPDRAPELFRRTFEETLLLSPSFTLRGGTREILRGVIARGLGLR